MTCRSCGDQVERQRATGSGEGGGGGGSGGGSGSGNGSGNGGGGGGGGGGGNGGNGGMSFVDVPRSAAKFEGLLLQAARDSSQLLSTYL
jgi:hypothetical protein